MKKLLGGIDKAMFFWCKLLTGILACSMIVSVFLRYVFDLTFVWAEEFITMVFIATTFFGAAVATRENEHISIDSLIEVLPEKVRMLLNIFSHLVISVVLGFVFYYSLNWIEKAGDLLTPGLRVPEKYFYYIVPVSSLLIIFYAVRKIISMVLALKSASSSRKENVN
jgi:TRAP-type C4-dicarboxylate transport system permease small subunit